MSIIHSSSALLGRRSALMAGMARCRTVRSMTYSTHAREITARPIHSLRPALGGGRVSLSRCIGYLRFSTVTRLDDGRPRNSSVGSTRDPRQGFPGGEVHPPEEATELPGR